LQQNWPEAAHDDVRSNVGCWGRSENLVLALSFTGSDPKQTSGCG
jgi:hypothetical protein